MIALLLHLKVNPYIALPVGMLLDFSIGVGLIYILNNLRY